MAYAGAPYPGDAPFRRSQIYYEIDLLKGWVYCTHATIARSHASC